MMNPSASLRPPARSALDRAPPHLRALADALADADVDEPLPPAVVAAARATGQSGVAFLVEVLRDRALLDVDAPGDGWAVGRAASLLAALDAAEAIAPLLELLEDLDALDGVYSDVSFALSAFGAAVVDPALARLARRPDDDARTSLLCVLAESGAKDDRVFAALTKELRVQPGLVGGLLGIYGDTRALPALHAALDRARDEQDIIELASSIEELGGTLSDAQRRKRDGVKPLDEVAIGELLTALFGGGTTPPPSRNGPCPCGSGKKHKRCCGLTDA